MRRGDIVTIALSGDFGKPRPALIVQSDLFNETHATFTVLPISSEIIDSPLFRIVLEPTPENGLRKVSQVMVDKIVSVKHERIGKPIGHILDDAMLRITRALALWIGVA